jgi:trehalose 6-phosphate phosphatase
VSGAGGGAVSPFDDLSAIRARLVDGGVTLVALDFDGTLTEIVDDPAAPGLASLRWAVLTRIPAPDRHLAIVSGRALEDVRRRVAIRDVILVGNHGLEIEGPGIHERPAPEVAAALAAVIAESQRATREMSRTRRHVWIEDKQWTASVHVRPRDDASFHVEVGARIQPIVESAGFVLRPGKATWEIRPPGARDKGGAVHAILAPIRGSQQRTLYAGDDATDEDAFRALSEGVTIRVGTGETTARYRLPSPDAVYDFLGALFLTGGA